MAMAALISSSSSSSSWIPEDDLLLKNAVESGASLEALAKGAVQFSRKFTVQELRDRWHSLLYDPVISNEASSRMTKAELVSSITGPRTNKNGNSSVPMKRKLESVRKLYYSLRKRTWRQPLDTTIRNFVYSPTVNSSISYVNGNGNNQEQPRIITKPSLENHIRDDFIQNQFGFQEMDGDKTTFCSSYVDLSECLLNFAHEDELHLLDVGEETATNKSKDCSPNPCSLSISDNIYQKDAPCVEEPQNSVPTEIFPDPNDEMDCTLNAMDLEFPCNDHIFPRKSFGYSGLRKRCAELGILGFPSANRRKKSGQKEKSRLPESLPMTRMYGNVKNGHAVKKEFPDDKFYYSVASAKVNTGHGVPTQCRAATLAPNSAANIRVNTEPLHAKEKSIIRNIPEPEKSPLLLDLEESLISEESENGDLPCYSDVEAMILEMDLCPDEPGSCASKEVTLKYRDESTRRSIIRLEQGARSSMQRCIASKGAFALFYGRHLKHYIKEAEVVIGRGTDESEVDIDLRREGPAQKISRRQAIIKLESDGLFSLTNLGKNSVYLNGMEVQTGHVALLKPSSLIEIKDFSFIFEIDFKGVARYISQIAGGNCEKKSKFNWSEEGIP